ncbi:putative toxin-antitoxin system toxin component, PIN family [Anaerovibrio lipolyticus DSM 3074]|uniref:Toxin PIN n=2 Tax=Anaerovibrio lipolyticus TaxID=82374 RepID=A0A0B2JW48_9FIRM|nr:putative toxin-antitoxin system toxin component, PIN family [Anaerovibrio lipolyticus]KHM51809.1 toxin PIN [Anaerovibrio lipolyticus]SHJ10329.1 putative toxin-antitoxin system toxin component, PIN family [Anaerovibrio lipolyticus DSM 3074]
MIYAVIDTNVFIAALLTKNTDSATVKVYDAIADGRVTILYHQKILEEYYDVLHRPKFKFSEDKIKNIIDMVIKYGIEVFPKSTGEILVDMDDLVFYEVVMEKRSDNSYLVTGNKKHYPIKSFIVTPAEMMEILKKE